MPELKRAGSVAGALALLSVAGCGTVPPTASAPEPTPTLSPTVLQAASPSPSQVAPTPSATAQPAGPVVIRYGDRLRLTGSQLTFREIRWYTGKAIRARCKEKHITSPTAWCNDYYYETTSRHTSVGVGDGTRIRVLTEEPKLVPATRQTLTAAVKADVWPNFKITSKGREAIRIDQVFTS